MPEPLTDDQHTRLRGIADEPTECASCGLSSVNLEDCVDALPALLDENDRLRENATATRGETTLLRERAAHAEQERDRLREERLDALKAMAEARRKAKDAMDRRDIEAVLALETAHQLAHLIEQVRAEADAIEAIDHDRPDALAQLADRLHQACARAGGQH